MESSHVGVPQPLRADFPLGFGRPCVQTSIWSTISFLVVVEIAGSSEQDKCNFHEPQFFPVYKREIKNLETSDNVR